MVFLNQKETEGNLAQQWRSVVLDKFGRVGKGETIILSIYLA